MVTVWYELGEDLLTPEEALKSKHKSLKEFSKLEIDLAKSILEKCTPEGEESELVINGTSIKRVFAPNFNWELYYSITGSH